MKQKIKGITKTKLYLKVISMILVLTTLTTLTTSIQLDAHALNTVSANQAINNSPDLYFVKEIEELRTENSKTFLRSDGMNVLIMASQEIHYYDTDKKEYVDIDNSLIIEDTADNGKVLKNKDNSFNVKLPKNLDKNKEVSIENDGYTLSFKLKNTSKNSGISKKAKTNKKSGKSLKNKDTSELIETVNLTDKAEYPAVMDNADISYDIIGQALKESIILKVKPTREVSYEYEITAKGLTAIMTEANVIYFYKSNEVSEGKKLEEIEEKIKPVFEIPAPYMNDSSEVIKYSTDIEVTLSRKNVNKYTLTYMPSYEWLSSEEIKYPVSIDPTVKASSVMDIYVDYAGTKVPSSNTMMVGSYGGMQDAFIKLNALPSLPKDAIVTNASLNMNIVTQSGLENKQGLGLRQVTSSWTEATGSGRPSVSANYVDLIKMSKETHPNGMSVLWDVTSLMKGWIDGSVSNYGVNIYPLIVDSSGYFSFASKENSNAALRPYFSIEYRSSRSLSTRTLEAGRAGAIQLNDYTGQITMQRNDIGFDGNVMPVNINMNYSSLNRGDTKYGSGFDCSYNQSINSYIWGKYTAYPEYYTFYESDGTPVLLKRVEESEQGEGDGHQYEDEDGLGYTMKYNTSITHPSSGTYHYGIVTDPSGREYTFDSATGFVTMIKDKSPAGESASETGSKITISRSGNHINYILDGAGRKYTFNYTNSMLSSIVYYGKGSTALATVSYTYNSYNMLTKVIFPDGKYVMYDYYDTSGKLIKKITLPDNSSYNFEYTTYPTSATGSTKVSRIKILGTDGTTVGQNVSVTYSNNVTKYTDNITGDVEILQFDNSGNVINMQDGKGNAAVSLYEQAAPNTNNKSQLVYVSGLQRPVKNILNDGSFESNSSSWTGSLYTRSSEEKYYGNYSLKMTASSSASSKPYCYQSVNGLVSGDTYTISAYVKTKDTTADNAVSLYVGSGGGSSSITENLPAGTNDWRRISVTFNSPGSNTYFYIQFQNGYGTVYVDGVQLEKGSLASVFNLVENGDFENSTVNWLTSGSGAVSSTIQDSPTGGSKLNVSGGSSNYVKNGGYQTINILNGKKGDIYDLSGWAFATGAMLSNDTRKFEISAQFYKSGSPVSDTSVSPATVYEPQSAMFNPDVKDWQFTMTQVTAPADYDSVRVSIAYYYQLVGAYFDNIILSKGASGIDLSDLDTGSGSGSGSGSGGMADDINNPDLSDPTSSKAKSEEDDWGRIVESVSAEGVGTTSNYDKYNNVLVSRTTNGRVSIEANYEYTSDGNYPVKVTDERGNSVTYNYNTNTGKLTSVTDQKGNTTNYSYTGDNLSGITQNVSGLYSGSQVGFISKGILLKV